MEINQVAPDLKRIAQEAIAAAGGHKPVAAALGIHWTGLYQWKQIPVKYVAYFARALRRHESELRPDIFRAPRRRAAPTTIHGGA